MSYCYNLKIQNVNEKCERNCVVYTQVFENQIYDTIEWE